MLKRIPRTTWKKLGSIPPAHAGSDRVVVWPTTGPQVAGLGRHAEGQSEGLT